MNKDQNPAEELTKDEHEFLTQLLLMTGREDRLGRVPFVDPSQIPGIRAIWPMLRDNKPGVIPDDARADLFNRLLLHLSIMTVSQQFFNTVFKGVDFADLDAVAERVNFFRILCMLDYGNFRYGYKTLRKGDAIVKKWERYFPSRSLASQRTKQLGRRAAPVGLKNIQASELFALGNLASEQSEKINVAREELDRIFSKAIKDRVSKFADLKALAKSMGLNLTLLVAQAGIPNAETLLDPEAQGRHWRYKRLLSDLLETCIQVDEKKVDRVRADGIQNARTYMAMHDLNVYVATSMRAPLHFTTNWVFVNKLFRDGELAELNLRYFDPTQTYLPNRVQMGLLECLMIKRAQLTVYHAQESDTFGKDCEAGVTLAQAKPVVVFVTRLFDRHPEMASLYARFDEAARVNSRDDFIKALMEGGLLCKEEVVESLVDPEKSKSDAIEKVVEKHVKEILERAGTDNVEMELIRQGYAPPEQNLIEYTMEKIVQLEQRAITFRDVHPLALQASPLDGVARGVIVTRTVDDTAKVVRGLLTDTLKYEIVWDNVNWLLLDSITRSPVRVVTTDPVLTSAFWSEQWGPMINSQVERGD